jgi:hypothetical protein
MVTRDAILKEIRRTAEANGGKPLGRLRFFSETGIKESDWSGRYWARWNDAVREAGYGPNALNEGRDDAYMLDRLAELTLELGKFPVKSEQRLKKLRDPNFPNEKTFARFGSTREISAALRSHCASRTEYSRVTEILGPSEEPAAETAAGRPEQQTVLGSVYLLKAGRYFKIGRSNALGRREREIALQLPERATLVHSISTDAPVGIEAYWHARFAGKRKNGEWFELDAQDVSAFRRRKFM